MVVAAIAASLAVLAFPSFLALRSMGSSAFEPETFDFALVAGSVFALALGLQVAWGGAGYVVFVASLAGAALVFGLLAIFSMGIALLPVGIVALVLLYRRLRRERPSSALTRASLGGAAMGFAVPLLFIAAIVPATVECRSNGGATSSRRWHPASFHTSSGSVDPRAGVQTGTIDEGDSIVTYRCEGARLVQFERSAR